MANDGRFYQLQDRDQPTLSGQSLREGIEGDAEVLAIDTAVDQLEVSELEARYQRVGHPAYPPAVMLKVLIYGYAIGLRASRSLARACKKDADFRFLASGLRPDFRTICRFRREHGEHLKALFGQTVQLCQQAGLVSLGHVAIDGTKIRANRSGKALKAAQEAFAQALAEAEAADADIPADNEAHLMKTSEGVQPAFNAQLAVDAAHQVIVAQEVVAESNDSGQLPGMVTQTVETCGAAPAVVSADGGYLSQESLAQVAGLSELYLPVRAAGIAGFSWDAQAGALRCRRGDVLTVRRQRGENLVYRSDRCQGCAHRGQCGIRGRSKEVHLRAGDTTLLEVSQRMQTAEGRLIYAARKQIVEPVFAHCKVAPGFRRFLLRLRRGARAEWSLMCIAHNLMKLAGQLLREEPTGAPACVLAPVRLCWRAPQSILAAICGCFRIPCHSRAILA